MSDVLFEKRGAVGIITLNRPKALNALTHGMIRAIRAALEEWAADDSVGAVVLHGTGERAFCAGGDVKMFHASAVAADRQAEDFWFDEYALISYIHHYPKPYISLLHGIVMGGGLGLSVPGAYRIAAENLTCAMPETGIGFFPDVGASWFLSRAPGKTGLYMAMSGARVKRDDAVYLGLVTHVLAQKSWPDFINALASGDDVGDLLRRARPTATEPALDKQRKLIDQAFAADSVEAVLTRLDAAGTGFAREAASLIRSRSPSSVKVAFAAAHKAKTMSFDDVMRMEYRIACHIKENHADFREGIRATVIDKDNRPLWKPAAATDVSTVMIEFCFAPRQEGELAI